jgi:hypothetical protein
MVLMLGVNEVRGQLFQQQFGTTLSSFNNSSTSNATYINVSPSSSQFTNITSSGTGAAISIASNLLTINRTGNSWNFARGANGFTSATSLMVRFDYSNTRSAGATTSAVVFAVGGGSSVSGSGSSLTGSHAHSRLAFN